MFPEEGGAADGGAVVFEQDNNTAAADNHNNQNVNTTNLEEQQHQQQFVVVTTTNGDGTVQTEVETADGRHVGGHIDQDDGGRTVIVREEVLKEEVEFDYDEVISSTETSDAVASVLPGGDSDVNMMDFIEEQVVTEEVVSADQVEAQEQQVLPEEQQQQQEEVLIDGSDGQIVYVTTEGDVAEVGSAAVAAEEEAVVLEDGEEVAVDGGTIGTDYFVQDANDVSGGEVIQMQEEEIIETPSSETEMSVAMEMAKLSQGEGAIYTSPSAQHSNNMSFTEDLSYTNGYSDRENTTPPPSIILPPNANVSGNRRSSAGSSNGTPPVLGADGTEKPRLSYAQLIAEALMNTEGRMLPLSEIYQAINKRYPYYRMDVKSWQNAIRHNLTLNPSFTKVPRPNNEGRGNFWRMEEGSEKTIFRRQIRAAQNDRAKAEQAAAMAAAKQRRQQQHLLNRATTTVTAAQQPRQQQLVTYQVVTQSPQQQQAVVSPSAGPTRYVCVRPGGTTIVNRPTIQLVSPAKNNTGAIQIISTGNAVSAPTVVNGAPARPAVVSATPAPVTSGPRIMKIKDTIVRQNGSVVFIAMPSNASAIAKTPSFISPRPQGKTITIIPPAKKAAAAAVVAEGDKNSAEEAAPEEEKAVAEEVVTEEENAPAAMAAQEVEAGGE